MVRARYKNGGRQIPQIRLASYNKGEKTERKSRQTWEEELQKILKERGIKWKGVRTIARNHERSKALRKPSTPTGRKGSTECGSLYYYYPCYHLYAGYLQLCTAPETNHVSMVYSDAAVLYLQFVLHGMLFRS
jgi:hypothetical protein